jgi:hypothetical protein
MYRSNPVESAMPARSIHANTADTSYFYLLMAKSCFRRAVATPHPKAGSTLRQIGRDYLAMANHVPSGEVQHPWMRH